MSEDGRRAGHERRRLLRVVLATLRVLATVVLLFPVLAILLLQSDAIATRLVNAVAAAASPWGETRVEHASLHGLSSLLLRGIRVSGDGGEPLIRADTLRLRIQPFALLSGRTSVTEFRLAGFDVTMRQRPDSSWDLLAPFQQAVDTLEEGGRLRLTVGRAALERGNLTAHYLAGRDSTLRVQNILLRLEGLSMPEPVRFALDTVAATIYPPARPDRPAQLAASASLRDGRLDVRGLVLRSDSSNVRAQGRLILPDGDVGEVQGIDFRFSALPLDFRDVGVFLPGFDVAGSLRLDVRVTGSMDAMELVAEGRTFDGATLHAEGTFTPRTERAVRYAMKAAIRGLDASLWRAGEAAPGTIAAELALELDGPSIDSLSGTARLHVEGLRIGRNTLQPTVLTSEFRAGRADFALATGIVSLVRVQATGRVTPFASTPEYEAELVARQTGAFGSMTNGFVRARVTGRGFSLDAAQGRATVGFSGDAGKMAIRDGVADLTFAGGRLIAEFHADASSGRIVGNATAERRGDDLRIRLPRLIAEHIDPGVFLEGAAGDLTLRAQASADRLAIDAVRADAVFEIARFARDSLVVESGTGGFELRNGALRALASLRTNAGTVELRANARSLAATPQWRLERLAVRGFDISRVRTGLPPSQLNGVLQLQGRGIDADATVTGALVLDSSVVGRARLARADLDVRFAQRELELQGTARVLDGTVELVAHAQPLDSIARFRLERAVFRRIDLAPVLAADIVVSLSGTLTAEGLMPRGGQPQVRMHVQLDSAQIQRAAIEAGSADFVFENEVANLHAQFRGEGGEGELDARATLAQDGDTARTITDARIEGRLVSDRPAAWLAQDTAPSRLDARFLLEGSGTRLESMEWTATVAASGGWSRMRLDTLLVEARVARGMLELDTLRVSSNVVRGGGAGRVALVDSLGQPGDSLRIMLVSDTVSAAGSLLDIRPLSLRGGTLVVDATNEADGIHGDLRIDLGGVIAGTRSADSIAVRAVAVVSDGRIRGIDGDVHIDDAAAGSLFLERADAEIEYADRELAFDVAVRRDEEHTLELSGRARMQERLMLLGHLGFGFGQETWQLSDTATIHWGDRMSFENLELSWQQRRIAIEGHIDRGGTQDLTLTLDSLPVRGFAEFFGLTGVAGNLNGRLALAGPAGDVTVTGTLAADLPGVSLQSELASRAGGLGLEAQLADSIGGTMDISGVLPINIAFAERTDSAVVSDAVRLEVRSDSFSLAWLTPFMRAFGITLFEGRLTSDVRIEGAIGQPAATGSARVTRMRVRMPDQGIDYRDITGDLAFGGNRIDVRNLTVRAEGSATVNGEIVLDPLTNPRFDLQVELDEFRAARNEWVRLGVSGAITIAGTLQAPRMLGRLTLVDTDVYADQAGQGAATTPVELTAEDLEMLETYFGYRPGKDRLTEQNPIMPWGMDMRVTLGSDVWVRKRVRPELQILVNGSLDLRKQPGDSIQLFGVIAAVPQRSYFEQFGRRFQIVEGRVTFNGPMMGWRADLEANYTVPSIQDPSAPEVVITLDVTGGWQDLRLELGAEPSLETADILSYLATGRPAASAADFNAAAGENQGFVAAGASVAVGALTEFLEQSAAESIGLDVVEIRQHGLDGATLVAGRYVSPRLFVGFQQPLSLRRSDDDIREQVDTRIEIEYRAYRWLYLNLQAGQSEFRYFFRARRAF